MMWLSLRFALLSCLYSKVYWELREQGVIQAIEEAAPPSVPMDLSQAKREGKVRGFDWMNG